MANIKIAKGKLKLDREANLNEPISNNKPGMHMFPGFLEIPFESKDLF